MYFNSKPVHFTSLLYLMPGYINTSLITVLPVTWHHPRCKFKYILEGYDKEWSSMTTERKVTYTNLPRGFYTFRVKASNNDGVWNEMGASVSFSVNPYYYETWWFRVLVLLHWEE
jgi:hypothetical protein